MSLKFLGSGCKRILPWEQNCFCWYPWTLSFDRADLDPATVRMSPQPRLQARSTSSQSSSCCRAFRVIYFILRPEKFLREVLVICFLQLCKMWKKMYNKLFYTRWQCTSNGKAARGATSWWECSLEQGRDRVRRVRNGYKRADVGDVAMQILTPFLVVNMSKIQI